MPTKDILSSETIARARELYADPSIPLARIMAETKLSRHALYYVVDGAGGTLPALPRRNASAGTRRRALSGDRISIVKRLWRTAERQVRDIEERLLRNQYAPGERGEDTRLLAIVVKTLRELSVLDDSKGGKATDKDTIDDDGPRDIDEFRRELARRMQAFRSSRTPDGIPGD